MKRVVFLLVLAFSGLVSFAQNVSNEGRNFLCVFPSHDPAQAGLASITIFVTSKSNTVATVSCGNFSQTQPIPANTAVPFDVPRPNAYIGVQESNRVLNNRSIQITVPANQPKVAAYAHIWAGARSAATLLLPFESLGQDYYSMNYTQAGGTCNFTVVVAAEANTTLLLHEKNGNVRTIVLPNAGDLYQYVAAGLDDQTGVYIEVDRTNSACKRFAVFSGSTAVYIGGCTSSIDPLFQQLYTTNSWGKNFGVVPFFKRKYIIRMLAKDPNTTVQFNGLSIRLTNNGAYYESEILTQPATISSDKPISVAQYSLTQNCSSLDVNGVEVGDPEMVLLNPVEFSIKNITMFSSSLQAITEKYVNVYMKTAGIPSFKINGIVPPVNWISMPLSADYSYIQIPVNQTSITLTASEPFNSIAYGFGNVESYAYSAGTSLAANQFITIANKQSGLESQEACESQVYRLKITIPGAASKLTWHFEDGTPDYIDNAPVGTQSTVNEQVFYTYELPEDKSFVTTGIQPVQVFAESPNASSGCSIGQTEYNFEVVVNPLPKSDFIYDTQNCTQREVSFTDKTTSANGAAINKWEWDFGDGNTATIKNPKHIYLVGGTYTVKLTTTTEGGCASEQFTKQITIFPTPVAGFSSNQASCINTDVNFVDQSTIAAGSAIAKWTYDYGDGTVETKTSNVGIIHQYAAVGKYTVKLIVESDKGCKSDVFEKEITVTVLPTVDFTIPEVCLTDALAKFENLSANIDGQKTGLTYLWNFGDNASGALNTSTTEEGQHKYFSTGDYQVTLTITNENGCVNVATKTITVNGAFPLASFEVQNPASLCSNQEVVVKNTSTVDAGKITRLEWYFDNVNNPTQVVVDEDPEPGKLYRFSYPSFSSPLTKNITIRLVAYSGGVCLNDVLQGITLKASPNIVFDVIPPVCINDGKVQLTQATETGQSTGQGTYSGTGITPEGLFDPLVAGAGKHLITYTFLNANGCQDIKTQEITVNENPTVNAGADLFVLEGGELKINATASVTGSNLTYKWTPSTGLDHDNILNPVTKPTADIDYTLTVTSDKGCIATDKVHVTLLKDVVPINSFTPNGDGINDVWNIKYIDSYPKAIIEIFNRYGDRVFFSRGYTVPFDGTYKNLSLPVGTYYFVITPGNGRKPITGSLTLIR